MKMNKKNMHIAVVHTFFELYTVRQLADRVVDELDKKDIGSVELHSSKQAGFTVRCKKDSDIDNDTVYSVIKHAMADMLESKCDEATDILADNYEIPFDLDMVTKELVKTVFEVDRNGRLIIIEIDE